MIFEWKQGLIWIHFELVYEGNRIKIDNCILDTGSATTAIDIDLIDFNYRKPSKIKRLFGIGGGTHEVIAQKIAGMVKEAGGFSNVSKQAMIIRLQDLGLVQNETRARLSWAESYSFS